MLRPRLNSDFKLELSRKKKRIEKVDLERAGERIQVADKKTLIWLTFHNSGGFEFIMFPTSFWHSCGRFFFSSAVFGKAKGGWESNQRTKYPSETTEFSWICPKYSNLPFRIPNDPQSPFRLRTGKKPCHNMEKEKQPPTKKNENPAVQHNRLFLALFSTFFKKCVKAKTLEEIFWFYEKTPSKKVEQSIKERLFKNRESADYYEFLKIFLKRFCFNTTFVFQKIPKAFLL